MEHFLDIFLITISFSTLALQISHNAKPNNNQNFSDTLGLNLELKIKTITNSNSKQVAKTNKKKLSNVLFYSCTRLSILTLRLV